MKMNPKECKWPMWSMAAAWLFLWSCSAANGGIEASGTLEAVQIRVPSQASGLVLDVMVDEGEQVSPGDELAVLDDETAALRRDQARSGRDIAVATLDLLLEGARREDLDQAREALSAAEENLRLATDEADRLRRLFGSGSVSEQQLDRAESTETLARGARAQAASALAKLEGGARSEEIDAARASLDQAEAALALAERALSDTLITAPSGGTILYRLVDPGEWAMPGATVFIIADLSRLRLTVYVSEPDLARIRLGGEAVVSLDGTEETAKGRVSWISPIAEFTPEKRSNPR
jgi:HlyD family secretion protein